MHTCSNIQCLNCTGILKEEEEEQQQQNCSACFDTSVTLKWVKVIKPGISYHTIKHQSQIYDTAMFKIHYIIYISLINFQEKANIKVLLNQETSILY